MSEYRISQNTFPTNNAAAGIATTIKSQYVTGVAVSGNLITVTYSAGTGTSGTIILTATFTNATVNWTCTAGTVPAKYRPANCRS